MKPEMLVQVSACVSAVLIDLGVFMLNIAAGFIAAGILLAGLTALLVIQVGP